MSDMLTDLHQVVSTLTRVLIAPASNMKVALPLYAMIATLLLLILAIGLMFVMATPEDEDAGAVSPETRKDAPAKPRATRPMSREMRLALAVGAAVVLLGVWVAAGFTTSDSRLCKSCHWPASEHAKAEKGSDLHAQTNCVSCHEPGGTLGRYVTGVPLRVLHLTMTSMGASDEAEYGQVTTRACSSCHAASLSGTLTNIERGLKVSHAEPLAASARCIDCHTMRSGIVSVHNAGMRPCLRCHDDSKASSACTTCHKGQVAAAARARTTKFQNEQIRDVSCSGCHDEKRDCDPCHGLRMPHTTEFKLHAHARSAAVDIWYSSGKTCGRCHTDSRNPCGRCHSELIGVAHGATMASTHKSGSSSHCNACHMQNAYPVTRDFCKDVCHSPEAIEASPR